MIYFISDTHFNHKNIIEYENRPFISVEQMNQVLIDNWNSIISDDDLVIHLGDVGLGEESALKTIVPQLKGHKILIKGNHDRKSNKFFLECGFEDVINTLMFHSGDTKIFLSHTPESRPGNGENYDLHFFGHVHTKGDFKPTCKNGACLCVELWNYKPVSLVELLHDCKQSDYIDERI